MHNAEVNETVRALFESLPAAARTWKQDIEANFRAVLQARLAALELTTRSEFDVQVKVLERLRSQIESLERRLAALEAGGGSPTPPAGT